MEVKYLVCDICGTKVDFEGGDKGAGTIEIVKVQPLVSPASVFRSEKLGEMGKDEIAKKIIIDLCAKCALEIEKTCVDLKEKHDKSETK